MAALFSIDAVHSHTCPTPHASQHSCPSFQKCFEVQGCHANHQDSNFVSIQAYPSNIAFCTSVQVIPLLHSTSAQHSKPAWCSLSLPICHQRSTIVLAQVTSMQQCSSCSPAAPDHECRAQLLKAKNAFGCSAALLIQQAALLCQYCHTHATLGSIQEYRVLRLMQITDDQHKAYAFWYVLFTCVGMLLMQVFKLVIAAAQHKLPRSKACFLVLCRSA